MAELLGWSLLIIGFVICIVTPLVLAIYSGSKKPDA